MTTKEANPHLFFPYYGTKTSFYMCNKVPVPQFDFIKLCAFSVARKIFYWSHGIYRQTLAQFGPFELFTIIWQSSPRKCVHFW